MKWLVIGLFLIGLVIALLGAWGYRRDVAQGRSADVAMGNKFISAIGFAVWGLDALIFVVWKLVT